MFDEQPDGDPHGECAAEIHRLTSELNAISKAIGSNECLDPPDGGDVPLSEQVRRLRRQVDVGREYAQATIVFRADLTILTEQLDMLRRALVGLVGADTEGELRQMEAAMRTLPAPESDKAVSLNAIHALLSTVPKQIPVSTQHAEHDSGVLFDLHLNAECDTLDEDHPLWLVNEQIKGLLEGDGASEDHRDVLNFLRTTGLPDGTVNRIHRAIVFGDIKVKP